MIDYHVISWVIPMFLISVFLHFLQTHHHQQLRRWQCYYCINQEKLSFHCMFILLCVQNSKMTWHATYYYSPLYTVLTCVFMCAKINPLSTTTRKCIFFGLALCVCVSLKCIQNIITYYSVAFCYCDCCCCAWSTYNILLNTFLVFFLLLYWPKSIVFTTVSIICRVV